jgi:hypothetical protein
MLAPLLFAAGLSGFNAGPHADVVGVAYVIDGDTIEITASGYGFSGSMRPRTARPVLTLPVGHGAAARGRLWRCRT